MTEDVDQDAGAPESGEDALAEMASPPIADPLAAIAALLEPPDDAADPVPGETGVEGGKEALPAGPAEPRAWGFSVEGMNRRYALVLLGAKAVIYEDNRDAPLDEQQRFVMIDAFNAWFRNKITEVPGADGKIKAVTWATAWLSSAERLSYKGVEFFPDPDNAPGTPGYLNLWSGFAVRPKRKANGYAILKDHILNNVCGGNEGHFRWFFAFYADIVQNPRNKPGVAIVLRGRMGSGKTKIGEVFGSLFPRHYFLVDDPRYVTGQFNAHMASCLLLQADEAVWAGDKAAEGRLKGLVTAPVQQIEAKGIDPIRLRNHVRINMTSNEDWVVPAGLDERRFAVWDVHPRCAQNSDYFREMDAELDAGGREALLYDLLHFDLASVNLRQIPRTQALLDQKVRSLDSVESWLFNALMRGTSTRQASQWLTYVPTCILMDDYIETAERIGIKRKAEETTFANKVRKILPMITRRRDYAELKDGRRRVWHWQMPTLAEARAAFEAAAQQPVDWDDIDGEPEPAADAGEAWEG